MSDKKRITDVFMQRGRKAKSLRLAPLLLAAILLTPVAQATIVERVVAVVGDKAILLSELSERAQPFQTRIRQQVPDAAARAAALSQLYAELIERLVDEELQGREAVRADIRISSEEVENALQRLARQNKLDVQALYEEAGRNGLDEAAYRKEIRRQLLDAKMLNLRVQGRMRVSEDDMRNAYRRLSQEEKGTLQFRAAWIRFQIPSDGGAAGITKTQQLAQEIALKARRGGDFSRLAKQHSSDPTTRDQGGLLAPMQPTELPDNIRQAVVLLSPGDVSSPVRLGDAWLVIKLVERSESTLPAYEEAKPLLQNRVYADKMDKARRQWLNSLRKQTHVDVRL